MEKIAQILLVEDNKMDIALTLDAFREAHLANKIHVAHNGEEALQYLFGEGKYSDRITYPLPIIILLDLKMPGIGGIEVLKRVKNTPEIKRIPIIILTSSKEEGDRALSYDYGANSYLVKPVSFDGFLEVVKEVTEYWITLNVEPPIG
jgi:CheY-like chemotaxis protein